MADVPLEKIDDVTNKMQAHKQTIMSGSEPSIPAL